MDLDAFIADQIARRPIEAEIVKRIVETFAAAGNPIIYVVDSASERTSVHDLDSVNREVFNLDEAFLYPKSGGWIRLTMGEEWDIICDYTLSAEDTLASIHAWIDANAN